MDPRSNKKAGSSTKSSPRKTGRKNPRFQAKKSGALKKPYDAQARCFGRDFTENEKKIIAGKLYEPVKENFEVLVEYLKLLESKNVVDLKSDLCSLIDFMEFMFRQCEVYLRYKIFILHR